MKEEILEKKIISKSPHYQIKSLYLSLCLVNNTQKIIAL